MTSLLKHSKTTPTGKLLKKPEGRNLLERLEICEDAVPRLITGGRVPLANNDAERPARMPKAHAKKSGCFKTSETAKGFRKMRGRIVGWKKNDMSACESIKMVVQGQTPEFVKAGLSSDVRQAAQTSWICIWTWTWTSAWDWTSA
jgi:hypothetical protein